MDSWQNVIIAKREYVDKVIEKPACAMEVNGSANSKLIGKVCPIEVKNVIMIESNVITIESNVIILIL